MKGKGFISMSGSIINNFDAQYEKFWSFPYGRANLSALTLLIQSLRSKIGKRLRIHYVALKPMAFQDSLKRIKERKVNRTYSFSLL